MARFGEDDVASKAVARPGESDVASKGGVPGGLALEPLAWSDHKGGVPGVPGESGDFDGGEGGSSSAACSPFPCGRQNL